MTVTVTDAAADAATEVVETVIDNTGKTLAYLGLVVGACLAVAYGIRHWGERAMDVAEQRGYLAPPAYAQVVPLHTEPDDDPDEDDGVQHEGYAETGDGQWAQ